MLPYTTFFNKKPNILITVFVVFCILKMFIGRIIHKLCTNNVFSKPLHIDLNLIL